MSYPGIFQGLFENGGAGPKLRADIIPIDDSTIIRNEAGDIAAVVPAGLPGRITPFSGTMGGEGNKHPINRRTGEADTSYALCDGGTYIAPDGTEVTTPNLQDRFVIGAGNMVAGNSGTDSHMHALTINGTTISAAQMPSHNHALLVRSGQSILYPSPDGGAWNGAPCASSGSSQAHTHTGSTGSSAGNTYYVLAYIMEL